MVNANPVLSIGLPIYNGEDFISEALDSLLAQTFQDFEIIISDNASSDRTPEICQAYAAKDSRITNHRSEQNIGAAWNYTRAFELSTGKYFSTLGSVRKSFSMASSKPLPCFLRRFFIKSPITLLD